MFLSTFQQVLQGSTTASSGITKRTASPSSSSRRASPILWAILVGVGLVAGSYFVLSSPSLPVLQDDPIEVPLPLDLIELPEGFEIAIFASGVEDARSMAVGDRGTVFVGSRRNDKVVALRDTDGDFKADQRYEIASGLKMPNGIAFRDGALWVAEIPRVSRYDDIEDNLANPPKPVVVVEGLPEEVHHGWKYVAFGPDGKLYIPVGAPCNVCERPAPFSTMLRVDADGTNMETVATGIRNTVGFDWHPESKQLWFSDNGRDMMGDDMPPDELNVITEVGQDFGFPSCHASGIADPEFGGDAPCEGKTLPALDLGPHVAALTTKFYTASGFPEKYQGKLFIVEHGSWNRRQKIGYRIMTVDASADGTASNLEVFAQGWLQGNKAWGRPVDFVTLEDGSILVSDDRANAIYRISYADE